MFFVLVLIIDSFQCIVELNLAEIIEMIRYYLKMMVRHLVIGHKRKPRPTQTGMSYE